MAQGATYPFGRVSFSGEVLPENQDIMFEVARELSLGDVWTQVWSLIDSETLSMRAAAAAAPIAFVSALAAALVARDRRVSLALAVAVTAGLAAGLIVVDRSAMSLLPGPDFSPSVLLR